jgi:heme exporter protein D
MDSNIFILNGYGQFVWPAFIFTFITCLILYLKTKKELQIQERIFFNGYKELKAEKIKTVEKRKGIQEAFSTSTI